MPSAMIHYCIANKILEIVKLDRKAFITGNLAPDAHNKTSEGRCKSHFQRKSTDLSDISAFENKYMIKKFDDFILGYYCHLIADTISYNNFNYQYMQGVSEEEKSKRLKMCYNDYGVLNNMLIDYFQFTKEDINVPECICVKEIKADGIKEIINEFQRNFEISSCKENLSLLNIEDVVDEINEVAEKCVEDIKKFGYIL